MTSRITDLVDRIEKLEHELMDAVKQQETQFHYRVEGTRVRFEGAVAEAHRELRIALGPWLRGSQWRNVLSAPVIYAMVVPIALLDLTLTVYQHICFRLYRIPRVARRRYVVIDRHQLGYLNGIEKLNCVYCGYGNGVIAYGREIIARTEQYWCPIKHARRAAGRHHRDRKFAAYGDAEGYRAVAVRLRDELADAKEPPT